MVRLRLGCTGIALTPQSSSASLWVVKGVRERYLQPLRLVVVAGGPGVHFALLVQPRFPRLPAEHVHVEGFEDAGGSDLIVLYVSRLHPQGLRAA